MRVVAELPHPRFKVTVFSWNEKYIIKVEIDEYEQSFKIKHMDVNGLEEVKEMVNDEFLDNCLQRFLSMRTDFVNAYKRVTN